MGLYAADGISSEDQEYNPTPIINDIRAQLKLWRALPDPQDWGVTPATARLLRHWRNHEFQGIKPFFCQIEAVETMIWLTEVARKNKSRRNWARQKSSSLITTLSSAATFWTPIRPPALYCRDGTRPCKAKRAKGRWCAGWPMNSWALKISS